MHPPCDDIGPLLSGYLDDELDSAERDRVELHLVGCASCRAELQELHRLAGAASTLAIAPLPDEVWDSFLENVYNRIERRTGWTVFLLGGVALAGYAGYHFVADPWAPATVKALVSLPVAGLGILFVSVWRQRRFVARTDRYSRDIRR